MRELAADELRAILDRADHPDRAAARRRRAIHAGRVRAWYAAPAGITATTSSSDGTPSPFLSACVKSMNLTRTNSHSETRPS
jgi:hypothetical protein